MAQIGHPVLTEARVPEAAFETLEQDHRIHRIGKGHLWLRKVERLLYLFRWRGNSTAPIMTDTMIRIAAGLKRAFAARGFAEPSVEDLRGAAGVSLRMLCKYVPSRANMVLAALEHRHGRYLSHLFDNRPGARDAVATQGRSGPSRYRGDRP